MSEIKGIEFSEVTKPEISSGLTSLEVVVEQDGRFTKDIESGAGEGISPLESSKTSEEVSTGKVAAVDSENPLSGLAALGLCEDED